MLHMGPASGLEVKFCKFGPGRDLSDSGVLSGYASLFGARDQGGDQVAKGAFAASLARMPGVKMLWQHDPARPIGVWDSLSEDGRGLQVKGRILTEVQAGREALALLNAGAIDGLSIGYRTIRAEKGADGGRILTEIELWEVSLVTFPMLTAARVDPRGEDEGKSLVTDLVKAFETARAMLA